MSHRLSDSQLVLMSEAAQRKDRCLVVPSHPKAAAALKAADRLVKLGLVEEVKAKRGMPVWRSDEGENFARRLTAAGLSAIKVEQEEEAGAAVPVSGDAAGAAESVAGPGSPVPASPRPGSKLAGVVGLLEGRQGATLAELIEATGWLPHTTRAALTGLRHKGFVVERSKRPDGATAYAIGTGTVQAQLPV